MIELLVIPADVEIAAYLLLIEHDDLKTLQITVGGYVQFVKAGPAAYLLCNEDGKAEGLPVNYRACALHEYLLQGPTSEELVGTVLVAGRGSTGGDITACPEVVQRICGVRPS